MKQYRSNEIFTGLKYDGTNSNEVFQLLTGRCYRGSVRTEYPHGKLIIDANGVESECPVGHLLLVGETGRVRVINPIFGDKFFVEVSE